MTRSDFIIPPRLAVGFVVFEECKRVDEFKDESDSPFLRC